MNSKSLMIRILLVVAAFTLSLLVSINLPDGGNLGEAVSKKNSIDIPSLFPPPEEILPGSVVTVAVNDIDAASGGSFFGDCYGASIGQWPAVIAPHYNITYAIPGSGIGSRSVDPSALRIYLSRFDASRSPIIASQWRVAPSECDNSQYYGSDFDPHGQIWRRIDAPSFLRSTSIFYQAVASLSDARGSPLQVEASLRLISNDWYLAISSGSGRASIDDALPKIAGRLDEAFGTHFVSPGGNLPGEPIGDPLRPINIFPVQASWEDYIQESPCVTLLSGIYSNVEHPVWSSQNFDIDQDGFLDAFVPAACQDLKLDSKPVQIYVFSGRPGYEPPLRMAILPSGDPLYLVGVKMSADGNTLHVTAKDTSRSPMSCCLGEAYAQDFIWNGSAFVEK